MKIIKNAQRCTGLLIPLMLGLLITLTAFIAVKLCVSDMSYKSSEHSTEELYQDISISLLMPYIQNEIDEYYSKYLTQLPMVAPYTVYILSAERPNGYRTFFFRIKLKVISYIGPHNNVGLDYITVAVGGSGEVTIEKFEHIKSFVLPPNYEDIIKKGYQNPIP